MPPPLVLSLAKKEKKVEGVRQFESIPRRLYEGPYGRSL